MLSVPQTKGEAAGLYHKTASSEAENCFIAPSRSSPENENITPTGFGLTYDYIYNDHTPSELSCLCNKESNPEGMQ
jgi:hypothetical protein